MTILKLCSGNGLSASFRELMPAFERAHSCKVDMHFEPAQILLREIKAGLDVDLGLLGTGIMEQLSKEGVVVGDTIRAVTKNGIGVGVLKGAAKPDISSVDAFKQALLNACTVAYTTEGASGIYFAGLIKKLGIEDAVKAKARTQPGGLVAELVVKGEAEIAVQQIPEILAVAGADYAGPIPVEIQQYSINAGAVFAKSREPVMARKLLDYLCSEEAAKVFRARGLDPQFA
jgi:molybdate transport system substrate-binding protein